MSNPIKKAFILGAGRGTRMRPLTFDMPKPLVKIAGKPLPTHIANHLESAGVEEIIINAHHLTEQITAWAKNRDSPKIRVTIEDKLLDTGGGVKNALQYFNDEPFYVIAGDAFWIDPPETTTLQTLTDIWNPDKMDILMILQDTNAMALTQGIGDYNLDDNGHARRSHNKTGSAMFTNIRINHPRIFTDTPDSAFSFLDLMDKAEKKQRLYGLKNKGEWHHISTPEDLERINKHMQT